MVALAADKSNSILKEIVFRHLEGIGLICLDFGGDSDRECRYPLEYAYKVIAAVATDSCEKGVICCQKREEPELLMTGIEKASDRILVLEDGMKESEILAQLHNWISGTYRVYHAGEQGR